MKAITVEPKKPGTVRIEDFPEPDMREGSVLVEAIAAADRHIPWSTRILAQKGDSL